MLNTFRMISMLEGMSYLILLFVAMPAKYMYDMPEMVTTMGWCHGALFMGYLLALPLTAEKEKWSAGFTLAAFAASLIPFACFAVEYRLRQRPANA